MKRNSRAPMALGVFLALAAWLAGCTPAAGEPKVVAALETRQIAVYPAPIPPVERSVTVYNLTLEMEVDNVQAASSEASRLNANYGGYLVNSQNWVENGRSVVFLEFAVPDWQSARLHTALLQLGSVTAENFATYSYDCAYCQPFAHISLYLRSRARPLPPLPAAGWDPRRTLQAATAVFIRIFGFLADVLIWLVVVGSPFVLAGWGIYALVRRLRSRSSRSGEQKPPYPPENPSHQ